MKKNISITIGGVVFAIEDNAYDQLKKYLSAVEKLFKKHKDSDEIINDIEGRIAEHFLANLQGSQKLISQKDVQEVIKKLGEVKQLSKELGEDEESLSGSETISASISGKRLMRDGDDKKIAGVAAGLAAYFGIDPLIVRLLLVIAFFIPPFTPFVFFGYFLLWFLVAEAKTVTDKMQMRGQAVSLQSIQEVLDNNVKFRSSQETSEFGTEVTETVDRVTTTVKKNLPVIRKNNLTIVSRVLLALLRIIGFLIVSFGLIALTATLSGFLFLGLNYNSPVIGLPIGQVFSQAEMVIVTSLAAFSSSLPTIFMILLGLSMYKLKNYIFSFISVVLIIVWLLAGVAFSSLVFQKAPQLKSIVEQMYTYSVKNYEVTDIKQVKVIGNTNIVLTTSDINQITIQAESFGVPVDQKVDVFSQNGVLVIRVIDVTNNQCLWCNYAHEIKLSVPVGMDVDFEGNTNFIN